ncbi:MAG: hypothetical protein ABIN56_13995 [Dokdonella sp.]
MRIRDWTVHFLCPALLCLAFPATQAIAQVILPEVTVNGDIHDERHGGYVISGDFQVDARMSSVIFPSVALDKGDILSVQPLRLADDEYFVLQECISGDCRRAQVVRVWGPFGATTEFHDSNRLSIPHDGKYFLWMEQLKPGPAPPDVGVWFTQFDTYSPPLVLNPIGRLATYSATQIAQAQNAGPVHVKAVEREGSTFVATFATGAVVRIKRMRAAGPDDADAAR